MDDRQRRPPASERDEPARRQAILDGLKRHRELATYLATKTTLSLSDVNGALCAADIDRDELIAAERARLG